MYAIPARRRPIPLPPQYSAEQSRSDKDAIRRIYVDRGKQRTEVTQHGVSTIQIWRPDIGSAYRIEISGDSQSYFTIPITTEMLAEAEADMEDDIEWEHIGTESLDSHEVDVFDAFAKGESARRSRVYVDIQTHIQWKTITFNRLGKEVVTVETRNVMIGPPPASVFELPPGLKEIRMK
jgi:hypothetical protein